MNQKKAGQTILAFYVVHAGERIRRVFTCDYSLFALASDGAAGSGPIPSGVHDEVLPRDQREGGDEEDHRTLRTHRQTAGPFFFCGLVQEPPQLLLSSLLLCSEFEPEDYKLVVGKVYLT